MTSLGPQFEQQSLPGIPKAAPREQPWFLRPNMEYFSDKLADERALPEASRTLRSAAEETPKINVDRETMPKLLASGRFLNQHETGNSNGAYAPGLRKKVERRMWGYTHGDTPEGAPSWDKGGHEPGPIYGYSKDFGGARGYGEFQVHLHPEVRKRTTYTYGDSLGADTVPISHEDAAAGRIGTEHIESHIGSYVEAQYHGGLDLGDIAHVDVSHRDAHEAEQLNWGSVPWRVLREERYEQHRLPNAAHGGYGSNVFSPNPVISRAQFAQTVSPGFHSPYLVSRRPEPDLGPTGTREEREEYFIDKKRRNS